MVFFLQVLHGAHFSMIMEGASTQPSGICIYNFFGLFFLLIFFLTPRHLYNVDGIFDTLMCSYFHMKGHGHLTFYRARSGLEKSKHLILSVKMHA